MTSRLDRLLILLDTGSSSSVRATAARQIAHIAVKNVRLDVSTEDGVEVKEVSIKPDSRHGAIVEWTDVMSVVAKLLPYLHSKNFDTRTAASSAISHICQLLPVWTPQASEVQSEPNPSRSDTPPEFPPFSVAQLLQSGSLLLASSGKEYAKANSMETPEDVAKAQKTVMADLGLGFLDSIVDEDSGAGWRADILKESVQENEDEDVKVEDPSISSGHSIKEEVDVTKKRASLSLKSHIQSLKNEDASLASASSPRSPSIAPDSSVAGLGELSEDTGSLSVRELNRLKRKRKHGAAAVVMAPPTSTVHPKSSSGPPPSKVRVVSTSSGPRPQPAEQEGAGSSTDKVVIDPQKGGQVDAKARVTQWKALEAKEGHWVWDGLVGLLQVDLFNPDWQVRHGAALALREVIKIQGASGGMKSNCSAEDNSWLHEKWCNDLAAKFLCVFVLDRFCDFVSDQVVAPVRETVSQTLASLLLHMPRRSVFHIHNVLLEMIMQSPPTMESKSRHSENGRGHGWEVKHAGLLGVKYEVAVRTDLVEEDESGQAGMLKGIVDGAVIGLKDLDDDVRSVAASCLIPVTNLIVERLPKQLPGVMAMLWNCLSEMKDDLGSSVGAVMELLGQLVTYQEVISMLSDSDASLSLSQLAPILFPFFRHTISSVRLAVVKTLHAFLNTPSLPSDWISHSFLRLLFQNLILEERQDIRDESSLTFNQAIRKLASDRTLDSVGVLTRDFYALTMHLIGTPFDPSMIYRPSRGSLENSHNVDKSMLEQDLSLVSEETVMKGKLAASKALAGLLALWPNETQHATFQYLLVFYTESPSALHKFLVPTIIQEWAEESYAIHGPRALLNSSPLASEMHGTFLKFLESGPPPDYHEMYVGLAKILSDCRNLLSSFVTEGKVPQTKIPQLPTIDGSADAFTLETANEVVGPMFDSLRQGLGKGKKKDVSSIEERKQMVIQAIAKYKEDKERYDTRMAAGIASAVIALRRMPGRLNPVIQSVMNGVKAEANLDIQSRFCSSIAAFVQFYAVPDSPRTKPVDKIINNLCAFICQDVTVAPLFSQSRNIRAGILSCRQTAPTSQGKGSKDIKEEVEDPEKAAAKLRRRGASMSLTSLAKRFGASLFDQLEQLWECMTLSLTQNYSSGGTTDVDTKMENNSTSGQNLVDAFTLIQEVVPHIDHSLYPRIIGLFPAILFAITSRFALIRLQAAQCMATLCDVITVEAMKHIVEHAVPLLGDLSVLAHRQGAMELISHVVQKLDLKSLPYVVFFVVHVLGRMSDPDDDVRFLATNTFASLVKMVPLEAGLPDPPGFSLELLQRRDKEREFLTQLLDGSKVEPYVIPVPLKVELRKYQHDGVNWLAFLAKFQLHGILCDDMGLGKTLQSICILAGKHYERDQRYQATHSPDAEPLPSLIVCPPTLTGHWDYEIHKYTDGLKTILYTSATRERLKLLSKLSKYDVVITSYDALRSDIDSLCKFNWHYCILDEGHIIKNSKTKLSKAVKRIHARHRLILSGTPIQNNVFELWSLFDFLMPGFLGTESSFNERFAKPIITNRDGKATAKQREAAILALEALHKQVLPFLLRRLKEDVLQDLPPKIIQDYYCELSEAQKRLYDEFGSSQAGHQAEDVVRKTDEEGQKHVFQSLQYLRKVCNHPALVLKGRDPSSWTLADAPKLQALRQLLLECGIGGDPASSMGEDSPKPGDVSDAALSQHRVLIFCQMKQMLDIIEKDLFKTVMPSVTYMRLDGATDPNKRHAIVQTFNSDPSIDCLLLTTHVGGLGLTLTGADTVIFVEHDWNPMKDLQAMDRAHRLGQKKVVNVYRLITKGTLEEKIMGLQRFKLNITNSVITQQNSGLASMETDLVLDLFKRGTDDEAAKKRDQESSGPVSQKNILEGLEDLPDEEEYAGLDLSSFMQSIKR